jgi:hypothetical protein
MMMGSILGVEKGTKEAAAAPSSSFVSFSKACFLLSYLVLGALHELAHVMSARALGYSSATKSLSFWGGVLLGRVTVIPGMQDESTSDWEIAVVRHSGWMASLLLLILILWGVKNMGWINKHYSSTLVRAATVVCVEAMTTDLLGWGIGSSTNINNSKAVFWCGNFGVIILNDAWVKTPGDNGKTVLDLLEKMVSITMMRGGTNKETRWCWCWEYIALFRFDDNAHPFPLYFIFY